MPLHLWPTSSSIASLLALLAPLPANVGCLGARLCHKQIEFLVTRSIKIFRSDNVGEYCSSVFEEYLIQQGIIHETTAPYKPAQNGKSKSVNRIIIEGIRFCFLGSQLSVSYHICYIL
jgi:transposase InsO family protein